MLETAAKWGGALAVAIIAAGTLANSLAVVIVGSIVLIVAAFLGTLMMLRAIEAGHMVWRFDLFPRKDKPNV